METLTTISQGSEITMTFGVLILIIGWIGSFVIAWTKINSKIKDNAKDIDGLTKKNLELELKLKEYKDKMFSHYEAIQKTLQELSEDVAFIKGKLFKD